MWLPLDKLAHNCYTCGMIRAKHAEADASNNLSAINHSLEAAGEPLRLVGVQFVKRGDYTLCVIHALIFDLVKKDGIIGYGFSKRHTGYTCESCGYRMPQDNNDRSVAYEYAFDRAKDEVFAEYRKIRNAGWR